jgi:hypothetical protein
MLVGIYRVVHHHKFGSKKFEMGSEVSIDPEYGTVSLQCRRCHAMVESRMGTFLVYIQSKKRGLELLPQV